VLLWEFRAALVGLDLGFRPWLMLLAVPAAVLGIRIARARRRFLTQRILVGVPEISSSDKGRLITDGIYGRVRNPRYLEFILLSFVYVAFANYSGVWLLYALTFPALHLVVLLEERELRERSGNTRTTAGACPACSEARTHPSPGSHAFTSRKGSLGDTLHTRHGIWNHSSSATSPENCCMQRAQGTAARGALATFQRSEGSTRSNSRHGPPFWNDRCSFHRLSDAFLSPPLLCRRTTVR
jgi:protein-S-isoprenylcysteine O-methyltransferase Ste14